MIVFVALLGCVSASDAAVWSDRARVTGPFLALATAGDRNCALGTSGGDGDEGEVVCWGKDRDHLLENPSSFSGTQMALGADGACVGGLDGYDCWGILDLSSGSEAPAEIHALALSREVVPYDDGRMCLSTDATTRCYGWDTDEASLQDYGGFEGSFDALAVGGSRVIALRDGRMHEALLTAPRDETVTMVDVGAAVDVAIFGSQRLVVTEEAASILGSQHTWEDVPGDWIAGDVGDDWACVTEGGPITCFGLAPIDGINGSFVDVGVGNDHVCGLTDTGCIVCEGDDRYGQSGEPPCDAVTGG